MPMENETLIDRLMYMYSGEQDPDRQTDVHEHDLKQTSLSLLVLSIKRVTSTQNF